MSEPSSQLPVSVKEERIEEECDEFLQNYLFVIQKEEESEPETSTKSTSTFNDETISSVEIKDEGESDVSENGQNDSPTGRSLNILCNLNFFCLYYIFWCYVG